MLTAGPDHDIATGVVCGEALHHASLSSLEYAELLEAAGLRRDRFVAEDPDCDMHSVLLAGRDTELSAISSDAAMRSI